MTSNWALAAANRVQELCDELGIGAAVELARQLNEQHPDQPVLMAVWADCLLWTGRPDHAILLLDSALAQDPDCGEAHGARATYAAFMGDKKGAKRHSDKARRLAPEAPLALLGVLNASTVLGKNRAALKAARTLFELQPESPSAWSGLYYTLLCDQRAAEATTMLDSASERVRRSGVYHVAMARHWLMQLDLKAGEKAARLAVEASPQSNGAWSTLAQCLEFQGELEEAHLAAVRALAINPQDSVALRTLESSLRASGDEDSANDVRSQANDATPFLEGEGEYYEILDLVEEEKLALALQRALDFEARVPDPLRKPLNGVILDLLEQMGRWAEIEQRLATLSLPLWDADAYRAAASVAEAKGDSVKALELLETGLAKQPDHSVLIAARLRVVAKVGNDIALAAAVRDASDRDYGMPGAYIELVEVMLDLGEHDRAVSLVARGRDRFPESPELSLLALTLALGGAAEEAA